MQHSNSVYLWHVCNILGYVANVESVMQVHVACVQLECCLHGACKHCVCIQFMCSKLVTFLHLVCLCMHEYVHMESVQPTHDIEWQVCMHVQCA
jgi:hypothetical protein